VSSSGCATRHKGIIEIETNAAMPSSVIPSRSIGATMTLSLTDTTVIRVISIPLPNDDPVDLAVEVEVELNLERDGTSLLAIPTPATR